MTSPCACLLLHHWTQRSKPTKSDSGHNFIEERPDLDAGPGLVQRLPAQLGRPLVHDAVVAEFTHPRRKDTAGPAVAAHLATEISNAQRAAGGGESPT
jgi:hypothetical protein